MRKFFLLISVAVLFTEGSAWAQTPESSEAAVEEIATMEKPTAEDHGFHRKWFYGYSFDVRLHNNSKDLDKQNGFSIAIDPEIGYQLTDKLQFGTKLSVNYMNIYESIAMNDKGTNSRTCVCRVPDFLSCLMRVTVFSTSLKV